MPTPVDEFKRIYLHEEGYPSEREALEAIIGPKGYKPEGDSQNPLLIDGLPISYRRERKEGIDVLFTENPFLVEDLENPHLVRKDANETIAYLCFKNVDEIKEFERYGERIFQTQERYGITNRGMPYDLNHLVKIHRFLGAGIGLLFSLPVSIPISTFTYQPNNSLSVVGVVVAGMVLGTVAGALVGGRSGKRSMDRVKSQRAEILGEYKTFSEEFNTKYLSRATFGDEALDKALEN
jgi:hypothetical protein